MMVAAKATTGELIAAHAELRSIDKVAARFGMCPQSVHERLVAAGYIDWKNRHWTEADDERLRRIYDRFAEAGDVKGLAAIMGRTLGAINNRAKRLGLQIATRPRGYLRGRPNFAIRKHFAENGHPRGMAGKSMSLEARAKMSVAQQKRWESMSQADRDALADAQIARRKASGRSPSPEAGDAKKTWHAGWRQVGHHRKYFRSRWEANYARYLDWLRCRGEILDWEHEPKTFWFEGIRRGVCSYKPDFRVVEKSGEVVWHEVKGWMDDRSRTTISRFRKFFPTERLIVIDGKQYRAIKRTAASFIREWE